MFKRKKDSKNINSEKEWFIFVENQPEGPYNLIDLKKDYRFNPDTLVWKKGFTEWVAARFVSELQEVFKDESFDKPSRDSDTASPEANLGQNPVTLTLQQDPYFYILWILVLFLVIFYTFYQLYR